MQAARLLLLSALLFGFLGADGPAFAQQQEQQAEEEGEAAPPAAQVTGRPYWQHRADLFRRLPNPEGEVVFLGDSITDGGEWKALTGLPEATNRGISGDTAWGIMARLGEVTEGQPAKVFLLVGTNDLAHGQTVAEVAGKITAVLDTIRQRSPETRIYLQSVLPTYGREDGGRHNERIRALNDRLAGLDCRERVTYVDIAAPMKNSEGRLQKSLSEDGLHLNGKGYYLWYSIIRKHLGS